MKVEREAAHRVPDGVEMTLADLGLLVAHLQTVGQAPPDARVKLRVDALFLTWETEQPDQAEIERELKAAAEYRASRADQSEAVAVAEPAEVAEGVYDPDNVEPLPEPARVGRRRG